MMFAVFGFMALCGVACWALCSSASDADDAIRKMFEERKK